MQREESWDFPASPEKVTKILSQEQDTNKRDGGMAQVEEHLLSIHEALSSIPNTTKKKEEASPPY
jgi:hypothetical protein